MDPIQAFLLAHIFDQFLVLIISSNCEKTVQYQKSYSNKPICTQYFGNEKKLATFISRHSLTVLIENCCVITAEEETIYC